MTNDELNRKVAEARGFTIRETHEECSGYTPGATWVSGGDYYEQIVTWCIPNAYLAIWDANDQLETSIDWYQYMGVSNICTDPAAWGGLLVEIADSQRDEIVGVNYSTFFQTWHANVGKVVRADPSPGRALALAYLASQGVRA